MTPLRIRFLEDMQLHGYSSKTQSCYVGAVRGLAKFHGKSPDQITEEELRQYFLYLHNVKRVAPNTANVALNAVKFLYTDTLVRPWPFRDLIRPPLPQKLPVVLIGLTHSGY